MAFRIPFIVLSFSFFVSPLKAQTVHSWLTTGNQSVLLEKQDDVSFGTAGGNSTITIDSDVRDQEIDGFGFTFTEGSAELIALLSQSEQEDLLNELFNKVSGLGQEVVRIGIGATDLSSSSYTYNDNGPDANLSNFSLAGPDLTYLIPLLKKIVAINPDVKFLATPWTAPKWMKTFDIWTGGQLQTQYYGAYANYFIKYFEAMRSQGIEIWAITPQNEPLHGGNNPSMEMSATEQLDFINNHLGPALDNSTFSPKIIAYDHNLDKPEYPIEVCNNSSYVDGGAFHLYGGDISAMTTFRNATGKNAYFTEQYTGSEGSFEWDMRWHMMNVFFGSLLNGSRTVLQWNLAGDENHGPHTDGGCTTCLGALTINSSSKNITRNVSYYNVAHFSKFVQSGAVRISAPSTDLDLLSVAFENPNGEIVLVVYNSGDARSFSVKIGQKQFNYSIPTRSVVSFKWFPEASSSTGLVTIYHGCDFTGHHVGLAEGMYTQSELFELGLPPFSLGSIQVLPGFKVEVFEDDNFEGTQLTVTENSSCASTLELNDDVYSIKVSPNGDELVTGTYFIRNRNSGLYLSVDNSSLLDGANISQNSFSGLSNQEFSFSHRGNGVYELENTLSSLVLDVQDNSFENGGNIQQWTSFQAANQQFIVVNLDDGFFQLVARHSGKLVEVSEASFLPEANVQQWDNVDQLTGEWQFVTDEVTSISNGDDFYSKVACFPNPAQSYLKLLNVDFSKGQTQLFIYNQTGQLVLKPTWDDDELDVSSLSEGFYMLEIQGEDSPSFVPFFKSQESSTVK